LLQCLKHHILVKILTYDDEKMTWGTGQMEYSIPDWFEQVGLLKHDRSEQCCEVHFEHACCSQA
jgi:hypothetical protein